MSRVSKTPAKKVAKKQPMPARKAAKTAIKTKPVKKAAAKKKVLKKIVPEPVAAEPVAPVAPKPPRPPKQPSDRAIRMRLDRKRKAAVAARKMTKAATEYRVGDTDPVIDDSDIVAKHKLAKIRRTAVDRLNDPPPATGAALVERVTRAVERELMQIETIVGGHHVKLQQRSEAERRARTLASLARTLSEVRRLRAAEEPQRGADGLPAGASRGPSAARDLDAFRRILSQRLEEMLPRTTPLPAAADEPGGDG